MELLKGKENQEKAKSLDVAEEAREAEWQHPSFVGQLFMGRVDWDLLFPFPEQDDADKKIGDDFIAKLEPFLKTHLDADAVDRTGLIPDSVMKGLAELGCFGMKIPKEYGGLGLSQINYNRAIGLVASHCGSTAVLLSAHQSIGVPPASQDVRHARAEKEIPPNVLQRRYLRLCSHGTRSRFRPREDGHDGDPDGGWEPLPH